MLDIAPVPACAMSGCFYGERVAMSGEWGLVLVQRYGTKMAHSELERDSER